MRRREFITLLGSAAAWPLEARAQQGERMRRIGVLSSLAADDPETQARHAAFLAAACACLEAPTANQTFQNAAETGANLLHCMSPLLAQSGHAMVSLDVRFRG